MDSKKIKITETIKLKLKPLGITHSIAFLYADDILLVAPSVSSLQRILSLCEAELELLDMRVNTKKSSCIRFGPRFYLNATTLRSGLCCRNSVCLSSVVCLSVVCNVGAPYSRS